MDVGFNRLLERLMSMGGKPNASMFETLKQMGISPENPGLMYKLLEKAGFDETQLSDTSSIVKTVEGLVAGLDPQTRKQFGGVLAGLTDSIKSGPVPQDIKEFIEKLRSS